MANDKRLTRSDDKMFAGICAGIGEYFNLDPTLIRIGYALLTVFSAGFPGILLYLILMFVVPKKG